MSPDGVYFGMPADQYHADPALGGGDHVLLASSPSEWQWRRLFGQPENEDTPAKREGRAKHTRILEGRDEMLRRHPIRPERDDYGSALLVTADDLREFCRDHGLKTGGSKADLIARVREVDARVPIWDEIVETFEADTAGTEPITREVAERVELEVAMIEKNPALKPCFRDGCPEVSVFWTTPDNIRCKARIDYLKIRSTVDLKTFRPWSDVQDTHAISSSISRYGYDVKGAHYVEARLELGRLFDEGLVFGDCPMGGDWLERAAHHEGPAYVWVFVKAEGAPLAYARVMGPTIFSIGMTKVQRARRSFLDFTAKFGLDEVWLPEDVKITPTIDIDDMPSYYQHGASS